MWVWLFFFFFRSGASTGGASEKGCRREREQAGGAPEVHSQEHKREEAAAGGAGGVSTGAESSGGCKSESLLTSQLLVNTRGNVDLFVEYPLMYTEGGWSCSTSTDRDSRDASDVQRAWQEEPPKKNREEEEELSARGVCVLCVPPY